MAGRHAVYRAAHLRGKRGTCREPGATLEYDHEPKIPAAMKLYRWVGIALLLLPQPGSCEEPGGMGAFRASGRCPSPTSCWSDGFWWEQALGSCAVSRRILPPQGLREACGAWCVIPAAGLGFPACKLEEVGNPAKTTAQSRAKSPANLGRSSRIPWELPGLASCELKPAFFFPFRNQVPYKKAPGTWSWSWWQTIRR